MTLVFINIDIRIERMRCLGHVIRMREGRTVKRLNYGALDGIRSRGRPRGRWKDSVFEDLKKTGVSLRHALGEVR